MTWSHHVLLAPLEPEQQKRWLDRAIAERLSVADLRVELRAARGAEGKLASGETVVEASGEADLAVCPHCGHELPAATD
ncbi:MAG TPA: hypothetical protein VIY71_08890 [Solirubrobacterales bacterium]